uniref:COX assembly mitochondrial protein n=1 Tax=Mesocestoides corti TaxID=53468 RepID=A0A5K3FD30_MESCO
MGLFFSKSDALDFTVLPSDHIEGPLGLGFPEDDSLNQVEKDTLIPALCMQHVRKNYCAEPWAALADCSGKWHWASLALCRRQFDTAMNCNKRYLSDPDFREQMTKRYLELRAIYRSTGLEPKY